MLRRWWWAALPLAFACVACAGLLSIDEVTYAGADGGFDAGADTSVTTDGSDAGDPGDADVRRDAPGPDAFVPTPDSASATLRCAERAAVIFCDDFEDSSFKPGWDKVFTGGTGAIDPTRANSGVHSLHVHTGVADGGALPVALIGRAFSGVPLSVFARMWVWVPAPANAVDEVRTFLSLDAPNTEGAQLAFQNSGATDYPVFQSYTSGAGLMKTSTLGFPAGVWTCIEVHVDTKVGQAQVWVDSKEELGLAVSSGLVMGAPTYVDVGLQFDPGGARQAYDMWIDDFVVDGARIGCQ